VLFVLSELAPEFEYLKTLFPNLSQVLDLFLISGKVLQQFDELNLNSQLTVQDHARESSIFAILGSSEEQFIRPFWTEKLAFFWLINSLSKSTVGLHELSAALGFESTFKNLLINTIAFSTKTVRPNSYEVLTQQNLADWIKKNAKELYQDQGDDLIEFCQNVLNTNESFEIYHDYSHENYSVGLNQTRKFSDQMGVGLSTRQRLTSHVDAFRAYELKTLSKALHQTYSNHLNNLKKPTKDQKGSASAAFPYEALLVGLALATGRSIEAVLKLRLYYVGGSRATIKPSGKDILLIKLIQKSLHKTHQVVWQVEVKGKDEPQELELHQELQDVLKRLASLSQMEGESIYDLLPFSFVIWPIRTSNWVKRFLPKTDKIKYKLRDSLARYLYKHSSNVAILTRLVSKENHWRNNDALFYYLKPESRIFGHYYKLAIREIFNKGNNISEFSAGITEPDLDNNVSIRNIFNEKLKEAEGSSDIVRQHNAISHYLLMLLVVATGHRKSRTPFYFPWDIDCLENLVFICDKSTVGSEARYVPIPQWLSAQVTQYKKHLVSLAYSLKSEAPSLSEKIRQLGLDEGQALDFGLFFSIAQNRQPKTISTGDLQRYYFNGSKKDIGSFRRDIATFLIESGLSGMQVEAFLGHNGDQHIFGSSSSWSIQEWAEQVRKSQAQYLIDGGWTELPLKPLQLHMRADATNLHMPSLQTTVHSYEGRDKSRQTNKKVAFKIIDSVIPVNWYYGGGTIDEKDAQKLLDESALLTNDEQVRSQLRQALSARIQALRNHNSVTSTSINLTRYEVGPVTASSARYARIAGVIRDWFFTECQNHTRVKAKPIESLAYIATSLIINDAVLDHAYWKALVQAIYQQKVSKVKGTLAIHITFTSNANACEKTLYLSPFTSALVLNYCQNSKVESQLKETVIDETKEYKALAKFIIELSKQIERSIFRSLPFEPRVKRLSISDFISIMSAWWQIRLPGALYSIATGQHHGPSLDIKSWMGLLHPSLQHNQPNIKEISVRVEKTLTQLNATDAKKVIEAINRLLKSVESDGNLNSKTLKDRLRKKLTAELGQENSVIYQMNEAKPIVRVYLLYIRRLLDQGGSMKRILKFSTIKSYINTTKAIIDLFWDHDLYHQTSASFQSHYKNYITNYPKSAEQLPGLLQQLHQVMCDEVDAPRLRIPGTNDKTITNTRCSLITPSQFKQAWEIAKQLNINKQTKDFAATYLLLGFCYGLRRQEAFGLELEDFYSEDNLALSLKANPSRSLKSLASRRYISDDQLTWSSKKHLSTFVTALMEMYPETESNNIDRNKHYLFADFENKTDFKYPSNVDPVVTELLRRITGNANVVPHTARHSYATRKTHFMIESPREMPISDDVEMALHGLSDKGGEGDDKAFKTFNHGYYGWPFWIDEAAMSMGHASADTLLNTYWHTSSVRMAEYTWHHSKITKEIKQSGIAVLLGRERSAITKMMQRIKNNKTDIDNINEQLITHYISKSKLPELTQSIEPIINKTTVDEAKAELSISSGVFSEQWVKYDCLLVSRLKEDTPLETLMEQADKFRVKHEEIERFIGLYTDILAETGIADFEPSDSMYLNGPNQEAAGVIRGSNERWAALSRIQKIYEQSVNSAVNQAGPLSNEAEKVKAFCALWQRTVDASDPWFVARNKDEVDLIYASLLAIGVAEEQLELRATRNFDITLLKKHLNEQMIKSITIIDTRISRGNKHIFVPEFGIRLKQMKDTKIGDGRDTHRLMMILAACIKLK
jgi:integrase